MNENDGENIAAIKVNATNNLLCQTNNKGRLEKNPANEFEKLFDFDNLTGQITNTREIPLLSDGYYMGCEFSPDSKLLFLIDKYSSEVHQFDVSAGNIAPIIALKFVLPMSNTCLSGIQIGPDLKLYLTADFTYLHVINAPNVPGRLVVALSPNKFF